MKKFFSFLLLFNLNCQTSKPLPKPVTIAHKVNPTQGDSEAIGYYSLGCLKGGKTFKGNEKGIVISQTRRGRFWGHSNLIDILTEIGEYTHKKYKRYIILGDLSLSRGGPTFGGHSSHQNGLDVDIWFKAPKSKPSFQWLQSTNMTTVFEGAQFNEDFSTPQIAILKKLAEDERVARIFVHSRIKEFLCQKKKTKFTSQGLSKIRPWYGHDDHLHLRLKCPKQDANCKVQDPPPKGDGCDQLVWWFSEDAKKEIKKRVYTYNSQKDYYIDRNEKLPKACQEIYSSEF